jgi:hypothetical protein
VKPVGVPGAFWVDVEPAAEVEPVDAVAAAVAGGLVPAAVDDEGAAELGVDADVVGVLDVVVSLAPVAPALCGDDEL